MEQYQGVKFSFQRAGENFHYDRRLAELNRWAYLFSQLGLTPVHAAGAYGNQSYRTGNASFIITRSGMVPAEQLIPENYCHVTGLDESSGTFITEGTATPSSESLLHHALYQAMPGINAILHGHSALLNSHAADLKIPVTRSFQPYGTPELARSAVDLMNGTIRFFILKDHGFVALGEDIAGAGKLTLDYFAEIVRLLRFMQ